MKPILKVGVVAVGYLAALLVASAAVAIRLAHTSGPDAQASSGMYAFGDALLFVVVFGVAALVPSGAALFALVFLACTVLSPCRFPRMAFLAATVMEAAVSAYTRSVWFVPLFFQ